MFAVNLGLGNLKGFGEPSVIGWAGSVTQRCSVLAASRYLSIYAVPISVQKIFDMCAEWRTSSLIPLGTCLWMRLTTGSFTSSWAAWPQREHVSLSEDIFGESVQWSTVVRSDRRSHDPLAIVLS